MADEKIEIEIVLDDGQIKKGFAKVKRSAKDAAKDTEGAFKKSFGRIKGELGALAAGFLTFRSITKVTGDFIAFERALAGVAKTTDITGTDLTKIGIKLQQLSTEIPVTANELLRLAQVAGQFGVRGTENIIKFTETVGKLQFAIEGIDPETAAQSLTRILNVTKQGVKNIDRLSSSLVDLGNNFEATEGDILATGNEVIRATAQFGITAEQGLALGAALQSVGAKAEGSGTAVGKAFRAIAKSISAGRKDAKKFTDILGISFEELKERFDKDAISVFQGLIKGLGNVKGGSVGLSSALKNLGLDQDRVIKSLVPLVQANDKLTSALDRSKTAYEQNTALNTEFARVNDTTEAAVKRLQNRITKLSTTIGTILGPTLRDNIQLVDQFTKFLDQALAKDFGTGVTKQLAQLNFDLDKVNTEIRRLETNINSAREKLEQEPDNKFLQNVLEQQNELLGNATARFIELNAEKDKFFVENPALQPIKPPVPGEEEEDAPAGADAASEITGVGDAFSEVSNGINEQIGSLVKNSRKGFQEIGKSAVNGIGKAAGGAFAAFGKALANGENGFKAFAGAVLQGFAQVAIQLGTQFLLTGIAYKFSGIPDLEAKSSGLIAAGAALATFGGALSALGGGGGEGSSGAGGDTFSDGGTFAEDEEIGEELIEEKTTKVAINVEGTVLDPQTVGNQIAQILNDTFEAGGTRVVTT